MVSAKCQPDYVINWKQYTVFLNFLLIHTTVDNAAVTGRGRRRLQRNQSGEPVNASESVERGCDMGVEEELMRGDEWSRAQGSRRRVERTTLSVGTESLLRTDYTVILNLDVMNSWLFWTLRVLYDTKVSFKISVRNDNYYIVTYLFVINNPKPVLSSKKLNASIFSSKTNSNFSS